MRERGENFWMDAGGRWRHGAPPDDWRQDEKGRWHPTVLPPSVRPPASAPEPTPVPPPVGWQPPIERRPGAQPPPRPAGLPPLPTRRRSPSAAAPAPLSQLTTPLPGALPLVAAAADRYPTDFRQTGPTPVVSAPPSTGDDRAWDPPGRDPQPASGQVTTVTPLRVAPLAPADVPWAELPEIDTGDVDEMVPVWRDPHPSDLHTPARTLPAGTPWPPPELRTTSSGVTAPALVTGQRNGHALPTGGHDRVPQGPIQSFKAWPRWGKALLPVAVLAIVIGMVATLTAEPPGFDNETAAPASEPTAPPTTTTATAPPPTTAAIAAPPTTAAPPSTAAPTTAPPPPTTAATTPPATAATTPPADPQQHGPSSPDHRPSENVGVRAGAYCGPEGATGISHHGTPMTCALESCDGRRYDQPHWRKTNC
jgi:hypothetical protein